MKVRQEVGRVLIDLSPAEAQALLEELAHVRGGSKLPKLRQVCVGLERALAAPAISNVRPLNWPKRRSV